MMLDLSNTESFEEFEEIPLKEKDEITQIPVRNAIILAAGIGMRMVPINTIMPKGLLEVKGQNLIERLIEQLHAVGIRDIHIVVGFMKEQYEYLMDNYGVNLIVNSEYASKNNLHSLKKAEKYLCDSYIVPCDLWCEENPFSSSEPYSWYLFKEGRNENSTQLVNPAGESDQMLGICFLAKEQAVIVRERIAQLCTAPRYDNVFWEEALYDNGELIVAQKTAGADTIVEINTYEQLRELDGASAQLNSSAISTIAAAISVSPEEIVNIEVLKKGMTNRSFLFSCQGNKYIMRIPGEGTDQLINRKEEASVYLQLNNQGLSDDVVYMNPLNGYKITRYLDKARVCDASNEEDLRKCIKKLREFHHLGLQVEHEFDIFGKIEFYESLWNGNKSLFRDYQKTKNDVLSLRAYIERHRLPYVLTHIDAIPDNFLFVQNSAGQEEIRLIDWEYAGMQDPHVDIAMFCIYSLYGKKEIDHFIDLYFENACTEENRIKIYCYIACCGLLWSNWCEYKRQLGVEFGEYSLRQYRYAKEYFRFAQKEIEEMEKTGGCIL